MTEAGVRFESNTIKSQPACFNLSMLLSNLDAEAPQIIPSRDFVFEDILSSSPGFILISKASNLDLFALLRRESLVTVVSPMINMLRAGGSFLGEAPKPIGGGVLS